MLDEGKVYHTRAYDQGKEITEMNVEESKVAYPKISKIKLWI